MPLNTEFCDREYREVTRTYAASFEDVIWCIRAHKEVEINLPDVIDGVVRDRAVRGYFEKYDENGFHFFDKGTHEVRSIGHDYSDYIEVV